MPSRARPPLWGLALLSGAVFLAAPGCGHHSGTSPTPPDPVGALAIRCPADTIDNTAQAPQVVTFAAPTVFGGSAPVATTCSVASGTSLPLGVTDVVCTATDAIDRHAECVFHVTVNLVAQLQGTAFLAFGDSITAGEDGTEAPAIAPSVLDPAHSYPTVLQSRLKTRYASQAAQIVVQNAGEEGQTAVGDVDRFKDAVLETMPDVVLLLEGTNDVGENTPDQVETALRGDIARAFANGARLVVISTLLPRVEGRSRGVNGDLLPSFNDAIRDAAAQEGAVLLDAYTAFDPQKALLIGSDGLHPSQAGYAFLATLFEDAIASHFEQAPTASPASLFGRPGSTSPRTVTPRLTTLGRVR
jgi:lysophospholipase L1-like esterase